MVAGRLGLTSGMLSPHNITQRNKFVSEVSAVYCRLIQKLLHTLCANIAEVMHICSRGAGDLVVDAVTSVSALCDKVCIGQAFPCT